MNAKKSLSLLAFLCGSCLLAGCGAGNPPPPPPISVTLSPGSALALDVNQSAPITAIASNDPSNQGFDWALSCGPGNCGTITAHTASGAPATFTAPATAPSVSVTITAKLTGLANSNSVQVNVSPTPTIATTGAITAATMGSPYSLQLAATGGAGTLTWALGGGTSLPDTLALSPTGMITGTPSGAIGTFNFKVHVTDSGSPPLTSPDVSLNIEVGTPPISVALSPSSAYVLLNGSTKFVATLTNDQPNGNVDWTITQNGISCPVAACGSVSPMTTTSGAPTTYTAPASVPSANITLTATTVDGTPPASSSATVTVGTHSFVPTKGSMETGREAHTATLLDFGPALTNGKVLVTGGVSNNNQAVASAEVFDPSTGTFVQTKSSMATARAYHTATLLNDGRILVTGGFDQTSAFQGSVSGNFLASAEIFDPTSETFTPTKGSMATARAYHTATLLKDGTVLVAGGADDTGALATAELFDPASGMFTPTKGTMTGWRLFHTATLLTDGKVFIAGGGGLAAAVDAEIFDPSSGTFTPTKANDDAYPRAQTATLLNDGTVLVTGGEKPGFDRNHLSSTTATSEIFDPKSGLFTPTAAEMAAQRTNHRAVLLNDGTVLVTGGYSDRVHYGSIFPLYLSLVELFDPGSGLFGPSADLTIPRAYHTATLLKDGTVLVTGGDSGKGPLATAELYQ
jgi:Galactose oxidase, central domain/Kelch motif